MHARGFVPFPPLVLPPPRNSQLSTSSFEPLTFHRHGRKLRRMNGNPRPFPIQALLTENPANITLSGQVVQLMSSQSTHRILSVYCGLLVGVVGCSLTGSHQPGKQVSAVEATGFWKPYLLYIQSTPYPRLYVEVDAVEGMAPDDESLRRLRDFLGAQCAKPEGIQIVRDTVIPRPQARGIAPGALARKYLAGPPQDTSAPPTAYIYILFFDTALSRDPGTNGRSTMPVHSSRQPTDPHALLLPYPAAILGDPNVNGPRHMPKVAQLSGTWLQHEAGHLLGLARDPAHAADLHCREKSCLMYPCFSSEDVLRREVLADVPGSPFQRLRLCSYCEAETQGHARESGPSNLRFVGPVMVRLEPGYQVATLPGRLKVVVGQFEEQDAWDFLRAVQAERLKPMADDSPTWCSWVVKPEARQDRARLRETLQRARQDPLDLVRKVAARI